jgi:hypothetical protein
VRSPTSASRICTPRGQTTAYLYGADDAGEYQRLKAFFLLTEEPTAYNLLPAPRRPGAAMLRRYLWAAVAGIGLSLASAVALATGGGD